MCFLERVSWQVIANHFCNKFISRYNVEPPGLEFLSETQALREREGRGSINWPKVGTSFNVTGFDIEMKVQCGPISSFNSKWSLEWDKVVGDERLKGVIQNVLHLYYYLLTLDVQGFKWWTVKFVRSDDENSLIGVLSALRTFSWHVDVKNPYSSTWNAHVNWTGSTGEYTNRCW